MVVCKKIKDLQHIFQFVQPRLSLHSSEIKIHHITALSLTHCLPPPYWYTPPPPHPTATSQTH